MCNSSSRPIVFSTYSLEYVNQRLTIFATAATTTITVTTAAGNNTASGNQSRSTAFSGGLHSNGS